MFQLDDWVLCRIHKKSNNLQISDHQDQEGSTVEEDYSLNNNNMNSTTAPPPKSEALDHQFHQSTMSMSKSCSLTDLLNTIDDCSTLSQLLLDAPAEPLMYPMTTTQTHQSSLNYNNDDSVNKSQHYYLTSLPQVVDACSDYFGAAANCNGLKRKRVMTTDDGAEESLLDDGGNNSFSRKLKLPSNSTRSSSSRFGSYCNQQQLVDDTSGFFQHSSLLSYPFIQMQ